MKKNENAKKAESTMAKDKTVTAIYLHVLSTLYSQFRRRCCNSLLARFWSALEDYTGFGASLVKAFQVLLIAIIATYPWWGYCVYISLAVIFREPLCYALYVICLVQFVGSVTGRSLSCVPYAILLNRL